MRTAILGSLVVAAACAAAAPVASADPAPGGVIQASCGGQPVTVVVNGNGAFLPGHNAADTSVFVPTALDLTFTFTPTGGSPQTTPEDAVKAAPIQGTTTCTIPLQTFVTGPLGTTAIEGTVTGFWTPRG
jgi:hypothetical protein